MFKNLKSLFVVEEEGSDPKKPTKSQAKSSVKTSENAQSEAGKKASVSTPTTGSKADISKFIEVLFKAMEKNNLKDFDYLEYKQSLQSLSKMPMDEATRFKSAFAMAQTMGVSTAHLIQTAEHYLKVLADEEMKFQSSLASQTARLVGDKEKEIQQMEALVKEKSGMIKKLTEEITAHQKKATSLQNQLANSRKKVETTKAGFHQAKQNLVGQIAQDIENMKKYLK